MSHARSISHNHPIPKRIWTACMPDTITGDGQLPQASSITGRALSLKALNERSLPSKWTDCKPYTADFFRSAPQSIRMHVSTYAKDSPIQEHVFSLATVSATPSRRYACTHRVSGTTVSVRMEPFQMHRCIVLLVWTSILYSLCGVEGQMVPMVGVYLDC